MTLTSSWQYLNLGDYFLIAEEILGIDAHRILNKHVVDRADSALHAPQAGFGDKDLYATVEEKAAVLCCRLARNHPLPDGNKRITPIGRG